MAGVAGIEPTHDGIKIHCLTAWLHPIIRVEESGFEPLNPKERIYSPSRLATSLLLHIDVAMAQDRVELPTHGASIRCSTN